MTAGASFLKSPGFRSRAVVRSCAAVLLGLLLFDALAVACYWRLVAVREVPAPGARADAVIVFCNGVGPHHGVDPVTRERLRLAASLVESGRARAVAGIGCHWKVNADRPDGMRRILGGFGLPPEAIFVDGASFDTASNWYETRTIVARQGWRELWLLSSPLHLFRIHWLIEKETPVAELARLRLHDYGYLPPTADGPLAIYTETHHEWLAWAGRLLLPEAWFRGYLRWRRK